MKNSALLILLFIVIGCMDNKKEGINVNNSLSTVNVKEAIKIVNNKVPAYSFAELQTLLTKNNDTTYVINFWATWCKPCVKELPAFEKLNAEYYKDKVKVILVSLDFPQNLETHLIPYIEKYKIQSQVILLDDSDANSWIPKVSEEWSGAIPATLIYKGDVNRFYERSFTYEELESELKVNFIK